MLRYVCEKKIPNTTSRVLLLELTTVSSTVSCWRASWDGCSDPCRHTLMMTSHFSFDWEAPVNRRYYCSSIVATTVGVGAAQIAHEMVRSLGRFLAWLVLCSVLHVFLLFSRFIQKKKGIEQNSDGAPSHATEKLITTKKKERKIEVDLVLNPNVHTSYPTRPQHAWRPQFLFSRFY